MSDTLYINIKQNSEVHKKDVFLSDVADVYCVNRAAESKAKALKVLTIRENRNKRYILAAIDVIEKLQEQDPKLQIDNLGDRGLPEAGKARLFHGLAQDPVRLRHRFLRLGLRDYDLQQRRQRVRCV